MKKQIKNIFTLLMVFASSVAMAQMNVGDGTAATTAEAPAQIVKEI